MSIYFPSIASFASAHEKEEQKYSSKNTHYYDCADNQHVF